MIIHYAIEIANPTMTRHNQSCSTAISTTPKEHSLASQSARTFFLQNK